MDIMVATKELVGLHLLHHIRTGRNQYRETSYRVRGKGDTRRTSYRMYI